MKKDNYSCLKLSNQMCFPLYAASKEIINRYKPILEKLGLTYTQYISMLVLWEHKSISVRDMGRILYLDSGTLTPLLKKLEQKGLIERKRDTLDERILNVTLTDDGIALRDKAIDVPTKIACSIDLTDEEIYSLYKILNKILKQ